MYKVFIKSVISNYELRGLNNAQIMNLWTKINNNFHSDYFKLWKNIQIFVENY